MKQLVKRLDGALLGGTRLGHWAERAVVLARYQAWCRAHPGRRLEERMAVHQAALERVGADRPIHYLEFGVFRGHTLRWWVEHNRDPDSRFVGFDSFRGLPEDWTDTYRRGAFDAGGAVPDMADARCSFEAGWFHETLPGFLCRSDMDTRRVVHLDADLFSSTVFVLVHLGPYLRAGDVLLFDEFHDYMDEFRALEVAQAARRLPLETIAFTPGYDGFGFAQVALCVGSEQPPARR